ncbi:hypothetical protein BHE74_00013573 [Ensete ventricosum]|nr:hypothetical protein BHE74_00013573 [Ensete ventricosum]
MEADATASTAPARPRRPRVPATEEDQVRVRRRALEVVLENCKRALELLENEAPDCDPDDEGEAREAAVSSPRSQSAADPDADADDDEVRLCALLKLKVESPDFLEKLGRIQTSVSDNVHDCSPKGTKFILYMPVPMNDAKRYLLFIADDDSSWDVITATDLGEDRPVDGGNNSDQDDYVLVRQEDIVDGVASFMAAYLLALKQTKKKKSRLQKAWDGSKVIYNVASWGATAIG